MSYHFRLYNGDKSQPNPSKSNINGVGWANGYDLVGRFPTFSDMEIGFIYKGGAWVLHRQTSGSYDTYIGFNLYSPNNTTSHWYNYTHINNADLTQRGVPVNVAFRLEWRLEKINETQANLAYYINGEFVNQLTWTVDNNGSAYFRIRRLANVEIHCRDYYECENDEPFLHYWEFRRVPFIAKPNQALTTAQLNSGSFNFTQTTEVEAELDTSDIRNRQTVLGVVLEGNIRWRRRSPRHFTHRQFVLEGQHLNYQQEFPEAAADVTNYTAITPITDSIQPRLLPQLDTNVKLRWEMEVEE